MTEEEWLSAADPKPALEWLRGKLSDRKFRLFAIACARRVLASMPDARSRNALDVSEQFADGIVGRKVLASARRAAFEATRATDGIPGIGRNFYPATSHAAVIALNAASDPNKQDASDLAWSVAGSASSLFWHLQRGTADHDEMRVQCVLLRDICTPFLRVAFDPRWQTETVVALATGIYADRAFDRLPILADAMEEAGCDNMDILSHCRGEGQHVRGCWVVDLILGKS